MRVPEMPIKAAAVSWVHFWRRGRDDRGRHRQDNKDAHDSYRLLRAVETQVLRDPKFGGKAGAYFRVGDINGWPRF